MTTLQLILAAMALAVLIAAVVVSLALILAIRPSKINKERTK